jgi:Uma2 family endonuclease
MESLTTAEERTFTIEEYYKLADSGILRPWERVELIDGHILHLAPISEPHATIVDTLTHLFVSQSRNRFLVRVQGPIRLDGPHGKNEPQPDITLFNRNAAGHHPTPADFYLVIEVMHSSAHRDLTEKKELYAEYNIPEYWIVDVEKREVFTHQHRTGFVTTVHSAGSISPDNFPDIEIRIADLFAHTAARIADSR